MAASETSTLATPNSTRITDAVTSGTTDPPAMIAYMPDTP
jgi:hypothetical protein